MRPSARFDAAKREIAKSHRGIGDLPLLEMALKQTLDALFGDEPAALPASIPPPPPPKTPTIPPPLPPITLPGVKK